MKRCAGSTRQLSRLSRLTRCAKPALQYLTVSLLVLPGRLAPAAEVQRIISLAPSVTETVFALGLGDRLVGVSVYCDYPPEAERIDRVGTFLTPNVEAIVAKRPDVVIAVPTPGNQGSVQALRRLGLQVVLVDPNTVAEIKESLLTIGRELGHEEAARALVARIDARIAAVQERLDDAPVRKVLMVVGQTPLVAVGTGTFQDELIRMAHGDNLAARAGGSWPRLSIEFAIAAAPQVIIDTSMGNEEQTGAAPAMDFWKAFPTIPAVHDGHVYGYKAYQVLRPGPRIAEAFEAFARFIHPERFVDGQHG
ncbi:MAG TPA: ABC transporter substrate-binding protein [Candidatus Margulisiibacteriota bacterium]|nr:ABC transporter substrate-binding protein [Candidatus Margulisiibacteriota bacterium]